MSKFSPFSQRKPDLSPTSSAPTTRHPKANRSLRHSELTAVLRPFARPTRPVHPPAGRPTAGDIEHRFRYAVDSQVLLDQGVFQSRGTERRKTHPGCRQTKRLAEMAGIQQHHSIGPRIRVLPHGPRKDARHDEKCRRMGDKRLVRAISPRELRCRLARRLFPVRGPSRHSDKARHRALSP